MRIVVVLDAFGPMLGADEAASAVAAGWHAAAPADELTVPAAGDAGLAAAMDGAGLALTGGPRFDWTALRDSLVTRVAGAAVERGVPCVVVAGQVSVGRREAASVGVDAAYALVDALDAPAHGGSAIEPAGQEAAAATVAALAALAERVARRWSR